MMQNSPGGLTQVYDPDAVFDSVGTNVVVSNGVVTSIGERPEPIFRSMSTSVIALPAPIS